MQALVAEQWGLQDLGLGKGVWGMVRGLTAMWELKASKVRGSVIVTVWLAQIGRAAVSAWLPCSSLHHGTEQPCTSAPTHQTRSGTHTVLGSHRFRACWHKTQAPVIWRASTTVYSESWARKKKADIQMCAETGNVSVVRFCYIEQKHSCE